MRLGVLPIERVVRAGLCSGCGACAAAAPDAIRMIDRAELGRRPNVSGAATDQERALAARVCPGSGVTHGEPAGEWGPVLEVWQGHATDPDVRFVGSSGGVTSALSSFCLEQLGMHGVLHTAARVDRPYLNETVMSTTRAQILSRTGSRYAPASPCEGLGMIEQAPEPCVFVGKPCDVAAAGRLASERPGLARRMGLTISIFCAGTPTTQGTIAMLREMGVEDPDSVRSLRYRGMGWPGQVSARSSGTATTRPLSYEHAWGRILTRHKQWRCKLCADHTGEFADIAVGDAWHLRREGDAGQSIIVVRTERGRKLLRSAMASGALELTRVGIEQLRASQPGLEQTRGAVWGRVIALRMIGAPAPRFDGMRMARLWWSRLSWKDKARSIVGTWRRAGRASEPTSDHGRRAARSVAEAKPHDTPRGAPHAIRKGVPT